MQTKNMRKVETKKQTQNQFSVPFTKQGKNKVTCWGAGRSEPVTKKSEIFYAVGLF